MRSPRVDDNAPSVTARRVAAYRMGCARLPSPGGDPEADDRLAQDVAGQVQLVRDNGMARYLQVRTTFFDRTVVEALARGVAQFLTIGAGYDGRALRFDRTGVCWYELDRAVTQHDKRDRLRRLQIATPHIRFVPGDLSRVDLATTLTGAGFQRSSPSLLLCEGVAVYLPRPVCARMLGGLRALSSPDTRLALSAGVPAADAHRRGALEQRLRSLGEPLLLGAVDVRKLLSETGWRATAVPGAEERAGLVIAVPA